MKISEQLLTTPKEQNNALFVDGQHYTYEQLKKAACAIADQLGKDNAKIGILSYRNIEYFASVFGCIITNRTFIPLGVKFPIKRLISIIEQSGLKHIIYSPSYADIVEQLIQYLPHVTFCAIDTAFIEASLQMTIEVEKLENNALAYIMFTSGSTGSPKGVPISFSNLASYSNYMTKYLGLTYQDKVSQVFDPTFDLSIHDMLITWLSGACLYVIPEVAMLAPGKFIKKHELTVWFSVPSTAAIMAKLGMLKQNAYPLLRFSLFCGEPLPVDLAKQFQLAAPNSKVINLYGPTEATIACSQHVFDSTRAYAHSYVPIGEPFEHMTMVADAQGELLISGEQVFCGYLNNKRKTQESIKCHQEKTYYHTGDVVKHNDLGELEYISRLDDQVKIQGYRVELAEIDTVSKALLNNPLVQSIAYPKAIPQFIALFICGQADKNIEQQLITSLKSKLPSYMIPKKVIWLDTMPLNSNGKIDKLVLHATLENI
ncbi:AMP-binding protein [Pseudoalteromonas umbrosa]|uniref:AMP-binding protein n=1 Tax=Pseudoalteromonas umbrosa TaxID=3048489 RepID=UPI0024C2B4D4|nr:AMP-binding protein [Pseudoalteromonas sp. B95]MDK1285606.1 AMP-binding protein [Pseudoalteromonas sp. B95]